MCFLNWDSLERLEETTTDRFVEGLVINNSLTKMPFSFFNTGQEFTHWQHELNHSHIENSHVGSRLQKVIKLLVSLLLLDAAYWAVWGLTCTSEAFLTYPFIQSKDFICGFFQWMPDLFFKQDWLFYGLTDEDCIYLCSTQVVSTPVKLLLLDNDFYAEIKIVYMFCLMW